MSFFEYFLSLHKLSSFLCMTIFLLIVSFRRNDFFLHWLYQKKPLSSSSLLAFNSLFCFFFFTHCISFLFFSFALCCSEQIIIGSRFLCAKCIWILFETNDPLRVNEFAFEQCAHICEQEEKNNKLVRDANSHRDFIQT